MGNRFPRLASWTRHLETLPSDARHNARQRMRADALAEMRRPGVCWLPLSEAMEVVLMRRGWSA